MSPGNSLKITVITVTYNCANVLQSTIDSVVGQSYHDVEYIVVDGASSDGTIDIIKANADKITHWISEPDSGIYDAMNKGIAMATGDYINFMNAGDTFADAHSVRDFFECADRDVDVLYGDAIYTTSIGEFCYKARPIDHSTTKMGLSHQAAFIKASLHKAVPYDTSYSLAGDFNFFYTIHRNGSTFQYLPLVVAKFEAETGRSYLNHRKATKEIERIFGRDEKIVPRVVFEVKYLFYEIKQVVKRVIPSKFATKIQHFNQRKMSR